MHCEIKLAVANLCDTCGYNDSASSTEEFLDVLWKAVKQSKVDVKYEKEKRVRCPSAEPGLDYQELWLWNVQKRLQWVNGLTPKKLKVPALKLREVCGFKSTDSSTVEFLDVLSEAVQRTKKERTQSHRGGLCLDCQAALGGNLTEMLACSDGEKAPCRISMRNRLSL